MATSAASLRSACAAWARDEFPKWQFILRTIAAGFTALWIAFRLGFSAPSTAIITVFIVSAPQAGHVLAKSFYRGLGTLVGAAAAVLLVGSVVQERNLFLLLLSAWLGLCTFGAAYFRGFQAYAFVLSGYTAGIIAIPALGDPTQVFDIALFRVSEVMLGILCASVFADVLLPRRTSDLIIKAVRGGFAGFVDYLQAARNGALTRPQLQKINFGFINEAVQFEALRESSWFENPEVRARSSRLRLFNAAFMGASTAFHGYFAMIGRVRRSGDMALADAFGSVSDELLHTLRPDGQPPATAAEAREALVRIDAFSARLRERLAVARATVAMAPQASRRVIGFDTIARQFDRFVEQLRQYTEAYASLETLRGPLPHRARAFSPHTETLGAVMMGVRAFAAVLLVSVFWVATAWPAGGSAALIAGVICALLAAAPQPEAAARSMLMGFAAAIPLAAVVQFGVLPRLDGFALLCAGVTPFLMLSTYAMATPSLAAAGLGFNLNFLVLTGFSNFTVYDPVSLLNNSVAQILGGIAGTLMLTTVMPARPAWFANRLRLALRRYAVRACRAPLPGLRQRFESGTRDLLVQLVSIAAQTPEQQRVELAQALAVLDLGDAVIHLRRAARDCGLDSAALQATLHSVESLLLKPTDWTRTKTLAELDSDLEVLLNQQQTPHESATDAAPHWRLHTNLVRIRGIVGDDAWMADLRQTPATASAAS